jgi:tripartite ATP-independent transporter DctM subunit
MIVYGVAAEVSIAKLFVAGVLPGLLLMGLFSLYVAGWALATGHLPKEAVRVPLIERIKASRHMVPVLLLIVVVIGSMYGGFATATEAAAVGVAGALVLSWLSGTLTWRSFTDALVAAMLTSTMIAFILAGAAFLTAAMAFTGLPRLLVTWIGTLGLSPYALLAALTVFFVILGCFIDGVSMIVLTTAVLLPVVQAAGIDLLWFGIYMVLVVEVSMITPPVGFNLFVLQAMTGRDIAYIARVTLPFFAIIIAMIAILAAFPQLVHFLPAQMS